MKTRLALCALAICLISTIVTGQQVSVNYNHNQSFANYHTYAWGSNNANQIQNSILAQVAQQDIDSALQGKGMQKVQESQNPDVIVTGNGGMKQQTSYSAWGMRGIGGGMGGITPEQNVEGTMVVDLYDAKTQSLVWRGIAQNTLNKNGNKNQQMVEKAVQKMFKQWPLGTPVASWADSTETRPRFACRTRDEEKNHDETFLFLRAGDWAALRHRRQCSIPGGGRHCQQGGPEVSAVEL
jgi:hypothetical protein